MSASGVEYDSEESQGSDEEEEEDDAFGDVDPNSPLQEHSNNNSYRFAELMYVIYFQIMLCFCCNLIKCQNSSVLSWCLMRVAMVQLVLANLKSFYPMAGYDLMGKN